MAVSLVLKVVFLLRMAKTGAERAAAYRKKLHSDHARYEIYKAKDKERKKVDKSKVLSFFQKQRLSEERR